MTVYKEMEGVFKLQNESLNQFCSMSEKISSFYVLSILWSSIFLLLFPLCHRKGAQKKKKKKKKRLLEERGVLVFSSFVSLKCKMIAK